MLGIATHTKALGVHMSRRVPAFTTSVVTCELMKLAAAGLQELLELGARKIRATAQLRVHKQASVSENQFNNIARFLARST